MTKEDATSILMSLCQTLVVFFLKWWFFIGKKWWLVQTKLLSVCLHFRGLGRSPVYGKCTSKRLFNVQLSHLCIKNFSKKTDIHLGNGYFFSFDNLTNCSVPRKTSFATNWKTKPVVLWFCDFMVS